MRYLKLYEDFMEDESLPGMDIPKDEVADQNKPIILIGPQGSGKSTTAKALAKKLGIPLITTDMCMVDENYEKLCKDEPGVEVSIERHSDGSMNYDSNDKYVFCVLNKVMEDYGDKEIVLDVGGTHAYVSDELSSEIIKLYNQSSNLFIFNVSDDEDETYQFLKKRRQSRGEDTKDEDDKKFRDTINKLKEYYKDTQKISIINNDKSEKTTDEIVDEIIKKLQ